MSWYIAAIIAMLSLTGGIYCLKWLQGYYDIEVYMFYVWLGTALFFIPNIRLLNFDTSLWIIILLLVSGIMNWFANFSYNKAMYKQPNVGYVESVSSIRVVILYIFSIFFLDSQLDIVRLCGCVLMLFSVVLLVQGEFTHRNVYEKKPPQKNWYVWSIVAGTCLAGWIAINRIANDNGVSPEIAIPLWLVPATLMFGFSGLSKKRDFRIKIDKGIIVIVVAIATYIIANLTLFYSYSLAPNLAYPAIITNSRLVLMYIISTVILTERVQTYKATSIFLAFLALILLR